MDAQRGIARRLVVGLPKEGPSPAWERDFADYAPAGVIVFQRDFTDLADLRRLTARLRELVRPRRLFIAIDEEGGVVSQLAGHLVVPPNALLLGRGAHPGDIEWIARVTGERLRALGLDWVFAPVADIHSEGRNPVIGPRSFGVSAAEVSRRVAEVLRGFKAAGIAACLKHFPGHGDTELDSHLDLPSVSADRALLDQRELQPFRDNLDAASIMTAHVVYPDLDGERPATFSRAIVTDLLRGSLGFEGVCVTDALEMKGASESRSVPEAGRLALEAGCDLMMWAHHEPDLRRARLELARALTDGAMDRDAFDAARPRLARFDRLHPEPTAEELAQPLESLTPPGWRERLETIVERGLVVRGELPASAAQAPWMIEEPAPAPDSIEDELVRLSVPMTEAGDHGLMVVCVNNRAPLPGSAIAKLRQQCIESPTALIGLQNDSFLDLIPEAVLRISAADATSLTRRVVARRLANAYRAVRERHA